MKSPVDEVNLIGQGRRLKSYLVAYKQNAKGEHVVPVTWPQTS